MNTNARWNVLLLVTLLLALGGCGGGGSGACSGASLGSVGSLVCGSSSSNQAPVALVSGPVTVAVRTAATLDGSGSKDPDGQALTYRWEISAKPAGSAAALSDAVAAKPVITPDVVGTYTVRLIVNDGKADSSAAVFSFTATRINNPPLAKAGDDLTAVNGTEVVLNGTGSSDPDGDLISYRWVLATKPVGSAAQLSGADTPRPFFTPDVSGPYVVSLVTSDGALLSAPAFVTVTSGAANVPPTAVVTGPSSVVLVGTRVTLDASGSVDPNGDLLRYTWSWISRPTGSAAVLGFTTTARPEFVPDQAGDYVVRLVVSDGRASSPERSVTVRAARTAAPLVNAGSSQSVLVGSTIDLDGSGTPAGAGGLSNATLLSYQWTLVSRPEGSSTARTILNASAAKAQFIPDAAGTTVTDSLGNASSDVVTVLVSQRNAPPVANAGGNRSAMVGDTVLLDGSGSSDANPGDVLTYAWQLISSPSTPQASTAKLSPASNQAGTAATNKVISITPDLAGTYVVGLTVNDGTVSSETSLVTITVRTTNQAPRAVITGQSTGAVRSVMTFDGRTSTDDGPTQLLTFRWRLEIKPAGSALTVTDPTLPVQVLVPDVAGDYVLRLQVDDGSLKSQEVPFVFKATP
ncbi:MAG: hypothetical protein EBS47_09000 [Betaproteobacteria bacterium]|nr:hypothetical protein [Betaproteobacteria bacterium]